MVRKYYEDIDMISSKLLCWRGMKTTNKSEKRTAYPLRPPTPLMEKYKELAIKNRRSLNDEIITAMEKHLAQHEQKEPLSP